MREPHPVEIAEDLTRLERAMEIGFDRVIAAVDKLRDDVDRNYVRADVHDAVLSTVRESVKGSVREATGTAAKAKDKADSAYRVAWLSVGIMTTLFVALVAATVFRGVAA